MAKQKIKYQDYYTKDECYQESLNYNTVTQFRKGSLDYYKCAEANGWLGDFRHFKKILDRNKPIKDRYTKYECYLKYLTCEGNMYIFNRFNHLYYKCSEINGWLSEFELLKNKDIKEYSILECAEKAVQYESEGEFLVKSKDYYDCASFNGWLKTICKHMEKRDKLYWNNKSNCNNEALKYDTRKEFEMGSPIAFTVSKQKGWLDKICSHMNPGLTSKSDFNKKRCEIEAKKWNELDHFRMYSSVAYSVALENGWLEEFFKPKPTLDLDNPTPEMFYDIAKKYTTLSEFINNEPDIFDLIRDNKWLDDVCSHIPNRTLPPGYWTKERCARIAKKFRTKVGLKRGERSVYNRILENGWMDELCFHMPINANTNERVENFNDKLDKWKTKSKKG